MEKKYYNIFWDGENSGIYKVKDGDNSEWLLTFEEAKEKLLGFSERMKNKYARLNTQVSQLKEKDVK